MKYLITVLFLLTACQPMTDAQRQSLRRTYVVDYDTSFHPLNVSQTPVYNPSPPAKVASFQPNYLAEMQNSPQPALGKSFYDCAQTSSCSGAFGPRQ